MESGKSQATVTILYVRNAMAGKHETYAAMEARRRPASSARISIRVGRSKQPEGSMADDNTPYPEEGHAEGCEVQPYASPAEACDIAMTRSERRRLGWGVLVWRELPNQASRHFSRRRVWNKTAGAQSTLSGPAPPSGPAELGLAPAKSQLCRRSRPCLDPQSVIQAHNEKLPARRVLAFKDAWRPACRYRSQPLDEEAASWCMYELLTC